MSEGLPALAGKPTLIVWGMRDIAFRARKLRRWQAVFPAARTVRLDDVGHYVHEEAPERLADEVAAFLTAPWRTRRTVGTCAHFSCGIRSRPSSR